MTKRASAPRRQCRAEDTTRVLVSPTDRAVRAHESLADSLEKRLDSIEAAIQRLKAMKNPDEARLRLIRHVRDSGKVP